MPDVDGVASVSVPPGPKYHVRAAIPASGHELYERSKPGYGLPGVESPVGDVPAPLSNSTRIIGCFSNAASAEAYVGCNWTGSTGMVMRSVCGEPIAAW